MSCVILNYFYYQRPINVAVGSHPISLEIEKLLESLRFRLPYNPKVKFQDITATLSSVS